jgi:hypothetical protein
LDWKEKFAKGFDFTYQLVKREVPDVKFACNGGIFYGFLLSRHFAHCYLYMRPDSIIYTYSGVNIQEIPFHNIRKIKIRQGWFFKRHYHIYLRADKRYHFVIYDMKNVTTKLTGSSSQNVSGFIDVLKMEEQKIV